MNGTNIGKLVSKAGLAVLKASALLILSTVAAGELRNESNQAVQKIQCVYRFISNKMISRKIKTA
jgi:hypothetical protein